MASCKHCSSPIVFRQSATGRWYPLNPDTSPHACRQYLSHCRSQGYTAVVDRVVRRAADTGLLARAGGLYPEESERLAAKKPLTAACPECGVPAGSPCIWPRRANVHGFHSARRRAGLGLPLA